jgi:hypothetical protein
MTYYTTPYVHYYSGHCFNRTYAQQSCQALMPVGEELGVTIPPIMQARSVGEINRLNVGEAENSISRCSMVA